MPTVAEKITIPSPPEEVWPLLSDPAMVASCIPGAQLLPDQDGGDVWKGQIRVKFGPTVAMFRGEATLSYDHDNKRCTIEGRGIDGRGASRALAHGVVSATGTTETVLAVEGEYSVSGPLETFANAGGVHVARALLAEFAKNMGALVAERRGGEPTDAPVAAAAAVAEPSGPAAAPEAKPLAAAVAVAAPAAPSPAPRAEPAGTTARAYVISFVKPRDAASFAEYRALAEASITAHRGRYIVRGGAPSALEGPAPESVVIVEFPTRAAAETWYRSPEYAKALALTGQSLERTLTLVDGVPVETKSWQPRVVPARAAPRVAAELSATTLLWAAFKSWLSSLFTKRS